MLKYDANLGGYRDNLSKGHLREGPRASPGDWNRENDRRLTSRLPSLTLLLRKKSRLRGAWHGLVNTGKKQISAPLAPDTAPAYSWNCTHYP
jgi:hypothetical protein